MKHHGVSRRGCPARPSSGAVALVVLAALILLTACAGPRSAGASEPADRVLVAIRDTAVPSDAEPALRLPAAPALPPASEPAPTSAAGAPSALDLPILMYHRVQVVQAGSTDLQLRDLSVPPAVFREHVRLLRQLGVETVGLDDVLDYLFGRRPPPRRAVVLTFDDGYEDTYSQAFPVLRAEGMKATIFVVTDLVNQPGYVTWDQLRELAAGGWLVESHSASHVDLREQPPAELRRQLVESRSRIEREIGRRVDFLSYPSGRYDQRVVDAAGLAGYRAAVTVENGSRLTLRQLFWLPRVRIHGTDDPATLKARLLQALR